MLLFVELFRWWYVDGWKQQAKSVSMRIDGTMDYFSFSLLLKTLFSPFRQISAGGVDGTLQVKLRAFVDKLFSRIIGAVVRLLIMATGLVALVIQVVLSLAYLLLWELIPLLPVIGVVLVFVGPKL